MLHKRILHKTTGNESPLGKMPVISAHWCTVLTCDPTGPRQACHPDQSWLNERSEDNNTVRDQRKMSGGCGRRRWRWRGHGVDLNLGRGCRDSDTSSPARSPPLLQMSNWFEGSYWWATSANPRRGSRHHRGHDQASCLYWWCGTPAATTAGEVEHRHPMYVV